MSYCAAVSCMNKVGETPGKTFHSFPTWNLELFKDWISRLGPSSLVRHSSVLCSDHFEESCFDKIGDVKHIRADAVPTLFFFDNKEVPQEPETPEKPQIISVISLDNLFNPKNKETGAPAEDPLQDFHNKIDEFCQQKEAQEKKKVVLQLLLSFKRFSVNQQKIKLILNRQRLLRRKMMQTAMIMVLLTEQGMKINS